MDILMTFPRYLEIKTKKNDSIERVISVLGYLFIDDPDPRKFMDSKGYIDDKGYVWIYQKKKPTRNKNKFPYFWISNGKFKYSHPSDEVKEKFDVRNTIILDLNHIAEVTSDSDIMYDEQAVMDMNNASSKYTPVIKPDDDYLKRIIKTAILLKNIDISRIKCKMENQYNLMNMKQALEKTTKMSVVYFAKWCEILGLDFTIIMDDNHTDKIDPLHQSIIYNSATDRIMLEKVVDSEIDAPITYESNLKKSDEVLSSKQNLLEQAMNRYK